MHFDFATILVIAALVTGSIYALDLLILAPRRRLTTTINDAKYSAATHVAIKPPFLVETARSFFPVILVVLILRSFIVEPFRIPSGSMMPTLLAGDFILVNKFAYGFRLPVTNQRLDTLNWRPQRGDVAVFRYPEDPNTAFIKRIVGLPDDRVEYRNKQLYVNDQSVNQRLVEESDQTAPWGYSDRWEQLDGRDFKVRVQRGQSAETWEKIVPPGHYFVLGDNRDNSRDSRFWGFLPEDNLIGEAWLIWMNFDCVTLNGNCHRIGALIQ